MNGGKGKRKEGAQAGGCDERGSELGILGHRSNGGGCRTSVDREETLELGRDCAYLDGEESKRDEKREKT